MCGIAGFIDFKYRSDEQCLQKMICSLHHRGPDNQSTWIHNSDIAVIGFAHARLSIIDLSDAASQPMHFREFTIVFNGEIYNFNDIKSELISLGHAFSTSSDTEVILHSISEWGVKAIDRFIGMFVFVLFNHKTNQIHFVRDRAGVKPLYLYIKENLVLFASELKAFHQHPAFTKEIEPMVLQQYFSYGCVPGSNSIFRHCQKILPAHHYTYNLATRVLNKERYWNPESFLLLPKFSEKDYPDIREELKKLMINAFNYRMVADVPIGVFLSGGYDSSAVAALLQSQYSHRLKTFTIGFEYGNNEAPYARQTADYLGTDHQETICTEAETQRIIPELPYFFDEPFGDSSAIPTILVSREAKKMVTVALSADGGDEIFAGYNSYSKFLNYYQKLMKINPLLHSVAAGPIALIDKLIPDSMHALHHKVYGIKQFYSTKKNAKGTALFAAMSMSPEILVKNSLKHYQLIPEDIDSISHRLHILESATLRDYTHYMPDDILTKVDRATMSASLEGREPLLDHRIWELAAQMPVSFKRKDQQGKIILKDIVHDFIPKEMMQRPKTGFSIPVYKWLRADLSYLIDEFLDEKSLAASGYLNVGFCLTQVKKFKQGNFHYSPYIWYLLMYQMWYRRWMR